MLVCCSWQRLGTAARHQCPALCQPLANFGQPDHGICDPNTCHCTYVCTEQLACCRSELLSDVAVHPATTETVYTCCCNLQAVQSQLEMPFQASALLQSPTSQEKTQLQSQVSDCSCCSNLFMCGSSLDLNEQAVSLFYMHNSNATSCNTSNVLPVDPSTSSQ